MSCFVTPAECSLSEQLSFLPNWEWLRWLPLFFWCRPLSASFVGGTLLVTVVLLCLVIRYRERRYWTQWYARDGDYPPTCVTDEGLKLVQETATNDPLCFKKERLRPRGRWRDRAVVLLTVFGLAALLRYFTKPETLGSSAGEVANGAALVLALTAAVLSLFAFFYQTRASVLSKNRQDWIHRVRKILARLEADVAFAAVRSGVRRRSICHVEHDLAALELHLNPRELDHRILVALLRRALANTRSEIDDDLLKRRTGFDPPREGEWAQLQLWIARLSTAIFKREWERVKHVR